MGIFTNLFCPVIEKNESQTDTDTFLSLYLLESGQAEIWTQNCLASNLFIFSWNMLWLHLRGLESGRWSVCLGYNDWFWNCTGIDTFLNLCFLSCVCYGQHQFLIHFWGIIMTGLVIWFSTWFQFHLVPLCVSLIFLSFTFFFFFLMNKELLGHRFSA